MEAFLELNSGRQIGMSVGPLSWRDIDLYAMREGLELDTIQLFRKCIRAMDNTYLKWVEKNKTKE